MDDYLHVDGNVLGLLLKTRSLSFYIIQPTFMKTNHYPYEVLEFVKFVISFHTLFISFMLRLMLDKLSIWFLIVLTSYISANCIHECINGGLCILNSTTVAFECSCKPGFSGSRCEKGKD